MKKYRVKIGEKYDTFTDRDFRRIFTEVEREVVYDESDIVSWDSPNGFHIRAIYENSVAGAGDCAKDDFVLIELPDNERGLRYLVLPDRCLVK